MKLKSPGFILVLFLFSALAIRIVLLQTRWINPDEGAHLLDARLWLEGQLPVADFGSRQPFYVLIIAMFLKIFGVHLWAGRLLPLVASLGVATTLYFFGKRWFSTGVGLVAAAVYALLPLVLIWSTIVKTEQLAILLGTLSMLFLLEGQEKKVILIFLSGVFAALAFYVRQPTQYLPMATILFLVMFRKNAIKNILIYLLGYLVVTAAVFLIYLPHMNFADLLFSQLNPLYLIWNRLLHLSGLLPAQYSIVDNAGFRILDQDMSYTLNSWYHALALSLFVLFGAIAALVSRRFEKGSRQHRVSLLCCCWAGFFFLLYLYQTANRGFYTQYFTEALPPLILLASIVIWDLLEKIKISKIVLLPSAIGGFYAIYLAQQFFGRFSPGMAGALVLSLGLAFLVYFYTIHPAKSFWWMALQIFAPILASTATAVLLKFFDLHDLYRFALILLALYFSIYAVNFFGREKIDPAKVLVLFGFFYAAFYSGILIGPKYEAIWSPTTLEKVSNYLRENGQPSDEILSGGTIWTFESGLKPYLNVPHPTEFYKHKFSDFELIFAKNPPHYIIVDGYTQRKYTRYWDFIEERMAIYYTKVKSVEGSKYVVEIYQLIPQARGESGFIAQENVRP